MVVMVAVVVGAGSAVVFGVMGFGVGWLAGIASLGEDRS